MENKITFSKDIYKADIKNIFEYDEPISSYTVEYFTWFKNFAKEDDDISLGHIAMVNQLYAPRPNRFTVKVYKSFRGSAKSTLISGYSVIYWAFLGRKPDIGKIHSVYIISATLKISTSHLQRISSIVKSNEKIGKVVKVIKERYENEPMIVLQNINGHKLFVEAKGPNQKTRGVTKDGKRCDVAIFDDYEDDSNSSNSEQIQKLFDFINDVIKPTLNPHTSDIHYIQTPITKAGPLIHYHKSKYNMIIEVPIINNADKYKENGFSDINEKDLAWASRFDSEYVRSIYETYLEDNKEISFYREYLLNFGDESIKPIKIDKIKKVSFKEIESIIDEMDFYLSEDLSSSSKSSSDYFGKTLVGVYDGIWFIFYLERERYELSESITSSVKLINNFSNLYEHITLVVEKGVLWNVAENSYLQEMEDYLNDNIFVDIATVARNNVSKLDLILTLAQRINNDAIVFVEPELYSDGVEALYEEADGITKTKIVAEHDDLIDSLAQLSLVKDAAIFYKRDEENEDVIEYTSNPYLIRQGY